MTIGATTLGKVWAFERSKYAHINQKTVLCADCGAPAHKAGRWCGDCYTMYHMRDPLDRGRTERAAYCKWRGWEV